MRVLITGASGFVGPHLASALRREFGSDIALFPTAKLAGVRPELGQYSALDVTDRHAVDATIARFEPTHVVHLAGIAAPTAADSDPAAAWRLHVHGALNVANAILDKVPRCMLVHVGSGLVYGESAKSGQPLDEMALLAPLDDYAVTKAAGDLAMGALARRGLRCVRVRPFNHIGTGQSELFVVPAFALQIARIEAGLIPPTIQVGNLDSERDFLDVRDVARAYALVLRSGDTLHSGTILNIASGEARKISYLLQHLISRSRAKIAVEQDAVRMRPSDLPRIIGNAKRARDALGWEPQCSFHDALDTILEECRSRVATQRSFDC